MKGFAWKRHKKGPTWQPATRCVVPEAGFEPARAKVCPEDFKSAVSAIPPLRPGARRLYNAMKSASTEAAPKEPLQEVRFTHPKALPLQSEKALLQNDEARDDHVGPLRLERSEEHTSELQSRENLVCRLLLEKKK